MFDKIPYLGTLESDRKPKKLLEYLFTRKGNIFFEYKQNETERFPDSYWNPFPSYGGIYKAWYGPNVYSNLCEALEFSKYHPEMRTRNESLALIKDYLNRAIGKDDGSVLEWFYQSTNAVMSAPYDPESVALLCASENLADEIRLGKVKNDENRLGIFRGAFFFPADITSLTSIAAEYFVIKEKSSLRTSFEASLKIRAKEFIETSKKICDQFVIDDDALVFEEGENPWLEDDPESSGVPIKKEPKYRIRPDPRKWDF